jgi:hypothetical protein
MFVFLSFHVIAASFVFGNKAVFVNNGHPDFRNYVMCPEKERRTLGHPIPSEVNTCHTQAEATTLRAHAQ